MILNPTTIEEIAQNREEWAAALLSGEYKQGARRLMYADLYCCLGVLSHLVDPEMETWQQESSYPPLTILDTVGLPNPMLDFRDDPQSDTRKLAEANDGSKDAPQKSFTEIAAMIRALPLPEAVTP